MAAGKFACTLTFKPFKTNFTNCPRVFRMHEYNFSNNFNQWHQYLEDFLPCGILIFPKIQRWQMSVLLPFFQDERLFEYVFTW